VRRTQARLAAEDADKAGDAAMRAGDPDKAIEKYRQAEMILRYNPLVGTGTLDEAIVAAKLDRAIQASQLRRKEADAKAREEAEAEKSRREQEERSYRENKVRTLFAQANAAFLNENYERAESLAGQVLVEDPTNHQARELQRVARDLRHEQTSEENRQAYREQWVRTFEELDTMNVPQTQTLVFDDLKRWAEVRSRHPLEFTRLDTNAAQDKQAVLDRLDSVRFAPSFGTPDGGGSPLADVASFLQSLTGVNFVLSPKVVLRARRGAEVDQAAAPRAQRAQGTRHHRRDAREPALEDRGRGRQVRHEGRAQGRPGARDLRGPRPDPPDPGLPLARDERRAFRGRPAP
jgi:hypothetical protein